MNGLVAHSAASALKPHIAGWTYPRGQIKSAIHPKAVEEMLIFGLGGNSAIGPERSFAI